MSALDMFIDLFTELGIEVLIKCHGKLNLLMIGKQTLLGSQQYIVFNEDGSLWESC